MSSNIMNTFCMDVCIHFIYIYIYFSITGSVHQPDLQLFSNNPSAILNHQCVFLVSIFGSFSGHPAINHEETLLRGNAEGLEHRHRTRRSHPMFPWGVAKKISDQALLWQGMGTYKLKQKRNDATCNTFDWCKRRFLRKHF